MKQFAILFLKPTFRTLTLPQGKVRGCSLCILGFSSAFTYLEKMVGGGAR